MSDVVCQMSDVVCETSDVGCLMWYVTRSLWKFLDQAHVTL